MRGIVLILVFVISSFVLKSEITYKVEGGDASHRELLRSVLGESVYGGVFKEELGDMLVSLRVIFKAGVNGSKLGTCYASTGQIYVWVGGLDAVGVKNIIRHELGHYFGLKHVQESGRLMSALLLRRGSDEKYYTREEERLIRERIEDMERGLHVNFVDMVINSRGAYDDNEQYIEEEHLGYEISLDKRISSGTLVIVR